MKLNPDEFFRRWESQIDMLYNQVVHLAHLDDVFWQLQAIAKENQRLGDGGEGVFLAWMVNTYVATILVGIRRLVDGTKNTVSFKRLLAEMESHCSRVLTRDRFLGLYTDDHLKSLGHRAFDRYAGPGARFLPREVIRRDRNALEAAVSKLTDFANEHYAHIAADPKAPSPTYVEIRFGLKAVSDILRNYYLLLKADSLVSIVPVIQGNWLSVFHFPWLPKGKPAPSYRHLDDVQSSLKNDTPPGVHP